jgi:hypothetical protein
MASENKDEGMTPPSVRLGRMDTASGVLREMTKVYRDARRGKLPLADACRYTYILQAIGKLFETTELEKRMQAIEARNGTT